MPARSSSHQQLQGKTAAFPFLDSRANPFPAFLGLEPLLHLQSLQGSICKYLSLCRDHPVVFSLLCVVKFSFCLPLIRTLWLHLLTQTVRDNLPLSRSLTNHTSQGPVTTEGCIHRFQGLANSGVTTQPPQVGNVATDPLRKYYITSARCFPFSWSSGPRCHR